MKAETSLCLGEPIGKYATAQASRRLDRFAFELRRAAKSGDADAIHDLRVAIRRFSQCLRVFGQFFPRRDSRKIRQRLRLIMDVAAEIRNRDITLALLREAGGNTDTPLCRTLTDGRKKAEQELIDSIRSWGRREFSAKWRARLHL
jgi:CHAD domain-containing protein